MTAPNPQRREPYHEHEAPDDQRLHCAAPRYLLEAIQAVPGDEVSIYAGDQLAPVLFAAAGADATFAAGSLAVVMPMRR